MTWAVRLGNYGTCDEEAPVPAIEYQGCDMLKEDQPCGNNNALYTHHGHHPQKNLCRTVRFIRQLPKASIVPSSPINPWTSQKQVGPRTGSAVPSPQVATGRPIRSPHIRFVPSDPDCCWYMYRRSSPSAQPRASDPRKSIASTTTTK